MAVNSQERTIKDNKSENAGRGWIIEIGQQSATGELKTKNTDVEMYKIPRKTKSIWKQDDLATSRTNSYQGAREATLPLLTNGYLSTSKDTVSHLKQQAH